MKKLTQGQERYINASLQAGINISDNSFMGKYKNIKLQYTIKIPGTHICNTYFGTYGVSELIKALTGEISNIPDFSDFLKKCVERDEIIRREISTSAFMPKTIFYLSATRKYFEQFVSSSYGKFDDNLLYPPKDVIQEIYGLIQIWLNDEDFDLSSSPDIPEFPDDAPMDRLISLACTRQLLVVPIQCFFISHYCAFSILSHQKFDELKQIYLGIKKYFKKKHNIKVVPSQWIEVILADIFAYRTCLAIDFFRSERLLASASINFILQSIVEIYLMIKQEKIPNTHPPSHLRLLVFAECLNPKKSIFSSRSKSTVEYMIPNRFYICMQNIKESLMKKYNITAQSVIRKNPITFE